MESVLNRVQLICDNEDITITSLERKIGASKGVLSRAVGKNTDIQTKWLQKIVENYPLYDANWLLIGKGNMLKGENTKNEIAIPREVFDQLANLMETVRSQQRVIEDMNRKILSGGTWMQDEPLPQDGKGK